MKQVLQSYKDGSLHLAEVPPPALRAGGALIGTAASVISAGTELQMMQLAEKSLLGKARARPDLVRRVFQKVRTEGVRSTWRQVQSRLSAPVPMGYSAAGEVLAVAPDVKDLSVGRRVACAGTGYASHSEVNFVPRNLICPIPDGVDTEEAAFVALGAIAMQGVRQADPQVGERLAVIGLGTIGQLTVQLLRAAGCTVVATDLDPAKCQKARCWGAEAVGTGEFVQAVEAASQHHGADAVIVTASGDSNEIMITAAEAARLRGRIVVVGFVGMGFPQKPFYEKELDVRFSMSYGPGRYDPQYEQRGGDYPYSLVRWTEGRNMAAFLEMLRAGSVQVAELITHRYPIDRAADAYDMLRTGSEPHLGIVLTYDRPPAEAAAERRVGFVRTAGDGAARIGLIGAGQFARDTLLPALQSCPDAALVGLCASTGKTAATVAEEFGFAYATCDAREILSDEQINAVVIATRHDLHAEQVIEAIQAGKHVLVEKPLALSLEELDRIQQAIRRGPQGLLLLVGHNRRFSPATEELRRFFTPRRSAMMMQFRVNAGPMDPDHWHRGPEGGGRWMAEGSHFVDFAAAMCGQAPKRVYAARTAGEANATSGESWNVSLEFPDGSLANIAYCDLGDRAMPKEQCELFADGKAAVLEDFKRIVFYASGRRRTWRERQDKGHADQIAAFCRTIRRGGPPPVATDEQLAVARATLLCESSRQRGQALSVAAPMPEHALAADRSV